MKTAIEIEQVDPRSVRDRVVALLWEHRHWPGSSREDYLRLWEWRYNSLAEREPLAWVARAGDGEVIGHVAIFPRRFRLGDAEIRCALPGDLLVHRAWRTSGLGVRLAVLPRQLVREGRFDMAMVVGNAVSHHICLRLGFHDLGTYDRYVDLRRSRPWLERRFAPAAPLGPAVDRLMAARRRLRRRTARRAARAFCVHPLDSHDVARMDRSHWSHPPERLVPAENEAYLARRFLGDPLTRRTMFALTDAATGRIDGHVTVAYSGGDALVCDCRVNAAGLDEATAIVLVSEHLGRNVAAYFVPVLSHSLLARELRALGFFHRAADEPLESRLNLSAFWSPNHPRAAELGPLDRWSLYTGAADA